MLLHKPNVKDHKVVDVQLKDKVAQMNDEYIRLKRESLISVVVAWTAIVALVIWSWTGTEFRAMYFLTGIKNMSDFIFHDLLPPNFNAVANLMKYALDSLYIACVGTTISIMFSLILSFMAAKSTAINPFIGNVSRVLITFIRAIPSLVIGIIFVGALGLGPVAGAVALGISGIGVLGKGYTDTLEKIDSGQVEAVRSSGAGWFQLMGQAVWPQFYPSFVSWSFYRLDLSVRDSAILGMIGAGGLGTALLQHIKLFQYHSATTAIMMIYIMINAVEYFTAKTREKIL